MLLCGLFFPALALLFSLCLKVTLNVMVGLIFLLDKAPFAHFYIEEVDIVHVMIYYAIILPILLIIGSPLGVHLKDRIRKMFRSGRIDKPARV